MLYGDDPLPDAQGAVIMLQHIISLFPDEPDVIYTAAVAIADIATEAAHNGTIVDPLMGSDFVPPSPADEPRCADCNQLLIDKFHTGVFFHAVGCDKVPVRRLTCTCCGESFQGRQFHNQDTGFGMGECCAERVLNHKPFGHDSMGIEEFERTYGVRGYHFDVHVSPAKSTETSTGPIQVFNDRELATILHGLRIIQAEGRIEGCSAADCDHFDEAEPLTNDEIDALCERLNLA